MERKKGVLRSWHFDKGFGIIVVGDISSLEKYFLHVSKIQSGTATPLPGYAVEFEISDKPQEEGKLRAATHADVIVPKKDVETSEPVRDEAGRR